MIHTNYIWTYPQYTPNTFTIYQHNNIDIQLICNQVTLVYKQCTPEIQPIYFKYIPNTNTPTIHQIYFKYAHDLTWIYTHYKPNVHPIHARCNLNIFAIWIHYTTNTKLISTHIQTLYANDIRTIFILYKRYTQNIVKYKYNIRSIFTMHTQ